MVIKDEVAKCNRCGFCLAACPVYQVTGIETKAPRGRNFLARSLLHKNFTWSEETKESLFQCLGCRACVEACFPAVETDEVVVSMRSDYFREFGEPWLQRYLFRRLLPDPKKLSAAVKQASLLRRGASLMRALSFLPWLNRDFLRALDLLPPLPGQSLREQWPGLFEEKRKKERRVAYFGGCAFNFAMPNIGLSTLGLLATGGFRVFWPEHGCCGLPAYGHGDLEGAKIMARKNLETFKNLDVEAVVTECASCSSFLKKYSILLSQEPGFAGLAQNFSSRVKDISEFLFLSDLSFQRTEFGEIATFHDPCHLNRFQKIRSQPRELLKKVPGLNLVEMVEADWCCGGGAGLNLSNYDLAMKILQRKMENVQKSKAQVLITSCPGCYLQLKHGAKKSGMAIEVRYLTEILAGKG
ncbi:MAG: (Fe-S)-binding protein [Deltaproteobacteria bacterium]|nr:(Fe-S)-binding protein [Deltaproteobacteria bacterium]